MAGPQKRSITIAGHSTSVSLETEFWQALADIAGTRGCSVAELIREIDAARAGHGLSSAARLFVLNYFRQEAGSSANKSC